MGSVSHVLKGGRVPVRWFTSGRVRVRVKIGVRVRVRTIFN